MVHTAINTDNDFKQWPREQLMQTKTYNYGAQQLIQNTTSYNGPLQLKNNNLLQCNGSLQLILTITSYNCSIKDI